METWFVDKCIFQKSKFKLKLFCFCFVFVLFFWVCWHSEQNASSCTLIFFHENSSISKVSLFMELLAKIKREWIPRFFFIFIGVLNLLNINWTIWNYSVHCVLWQLKRLCEWFLNICAFKIKTNENKFENRSQNSKVRTEKGLIWIWLKNQKWVSVLNFQPIYRNRLKNRNLNPMMTNPTGQDYLQFLAGVQNRHRIQVNNFQKVPLESCSLLYRKIWLTFLQSTQHYFNVEFPFNLFNKKETFWRLWTFQKVTQKKNQIL